MRLWTAARVPAARHETSPHNSCGGPASSTAETGRIYRPYGLGHEHRRVHGRVVVDLDHVGDAHANAPVRRVVADRPVLARVDAVDARAAVEGHPARFDRIV